MINFFSVDGGYSPWTSFSECSVTCGVGRMKRTRTCTNPKPEHGGKQCEGRSEQIEQCGAPKPCAGYLFIVTSCFVFFRNSSTAPFFPSANSNFGMRLLA